MSLQPIGSVALARICAAQSSRLVRFVLLVVALPPRLACVAELTLLAPTVAFALPFAAVAAVLARGYLRLTQKPHNCAEFSAEKALDLSPQESVHVTDQSPRRVG